MASVVLRPKALADLTEIWVYIAQGSERQADALIDRLDQTFGELSRHPRMGRQRPELLANLRSFPVGRYIVFYLPCPRAIDVIRVLHGSRDLKSLIETDF
jgi:toxin ParE1/3/4